MSRRVEIKVVAAAHLRTAEPALSGSREVAAASVAVRLHAVEHSEAYGSSAARKLEKFEIPEVAAVLAGGGAARVVAWDQTFTFTANLGRPDELIATFKVRNEDGQAVGEASASLQDLGDARPRETWLPLRLSDVDSEVALDRGFLRVVLLYASTPRIEVSVREGVGWFGAEHDAARVDLRAISLTAQPGSPRAGGAPLVERLASQFRTRDAGGLPNPQWEQAFVVAELSAPAQVVLEFEGTCGDVSLGKARLAFEDLPSEVRCDATVTAPSGAETAVSLRLHGGHDGRSAAAAPEPDTVGLAPQDFAEAIDDLDDAEVAETLRELGAELPPDATTSAADARRQRLRLLYGPRELRLSVTRILTETGELPALEHTPGTTPLGRLQAPAHQQREVCAIFVCERLSPVVDHHHSGGVSYAVIKRTALRPDFVEKKPGGGGGSAGGFVHLTAAGYAEAGTTVRVAEVRMDQDGLVHCRVIGKSAHNPAGKIEGWAAAEDSQGAACLRPITASMFTPVEMHVNGATGTVTVQPRLSAAGEQSALLRLQLAQLYAWETTSNGAGFCFRLSEGDAEAGLLDRATFRMRGSEGLDLAQLLDRTIRQRRDAGARYAGSRFCASALDPSSGASVAVNPLRRDYTVGFAVVAAASAAASAAIAPLLREALYTVTSADSIGAAVGEVDAAAAAAAGGGGGGGGAEGAGLLVVHHSCTDGFAELAAMTAADRLLEHVVIVAVLPPGTDPAALTADSGSGGGGGVLNELSHSSRHKLVVLVEPLQVADTAQLCWLLQPPHLRLPPGMQRSGSTPLSRQLTTSKVSGQWKVPAPGNIYICKRL
jgi:hypothetical protein